MTSCKTTTVNLSVYAEQKIYKKSASWGQIFDKYF